MLQIRQISSQNTADQSIELTSSPVMESTPSLYPELDSSPTDFFLTTAGSAVSEEVARLYQKSNSKNAVLSLLNSQVHRIAEISSNLSRWSVHSVLEENPQGPNHSIKINKEKAEKSLKELADLTEIFSKLKADLNYDLSILHIRILDTQSLGQQLKLGFSEAEFVSDSRYPEEWPCQVKDVFKGRHISVYNSSELSKIRVFYSDYTNHLFALRLMHIAPLISKITLSLLKTEEIRKDLKSRITLLDLMEPPLPANNTFDDLFSKPSESAFPFISLSHGSPFRRSHSLEGLCNQLQESDLSSNSDPKTPDAPESVPCEDLNTIGLELENFA